MTAEIVALTNLQIRALLDDRLDGTGPCIVRETLPWTALATTSVVPGIRILMAEAAGEGGRLTARGNLSRRLVEAVMDSSRWQGCDSDELRCISKVFNEHDFSPAMYLHAMLRLTGVARRQKGLLKLTRKGKTLLSTDAAGRLQATLFRATFTRYNLAYLDGIARPDWFAPQISLILYLIGKFGTYWRPADVLMRSVTIPADDRPGSQFAWKPELAFDLRVLRYLCWFGLLEEARPADKGDWRSPSFFRKTLLYDRMLSFTLK